MQGGITYKIVSKITTTVVHLFKMYVECEGSAISAAPCSVVRLQRAILPVTPL